MWLERRRADQTAKVLPRLYELRNLDDFPRHAVSLMPELIDSDTVAFNSVNERRHTASAWMQPSAQSMGFERFQERLGPAMRDHPLILHHTRTADRRALRMSDFVSARELRRLEVYQQLLHPLRMEYLVVIAHKIPGSGDSIALGFSRTRSDFTDNDKAVLELFRPHFVLAFQNAAAFAHAGLAQGQMLSTLEAAVSDVALVLVRGGIVRDTSPRARAWLSEYFPEHRQRDAGPLPDSLAAWVSHHTAALGTAEGLKRPIAPFLRDGAGSRLIVRLMPAGMPGGVLLIITRQFTASTPAILEHRLGLARREAAVLFWVSMGKTSAETAAILTISRRTVEKHLERLYQKLGVETRIGAAHLAWAAMESRQSAHPHTGGN